VQSVSNIQVYVAVKAAVPQEIEFAEGFAGRDVRIFPVVELYHDLIFPAVIKIITQIDIEGKIPAGVTGYFCTVQVNDGIMHGSVKKESGVPVPLPPVRPVELFIPAYAGPLRRCNCQWFNYC